MARDLTTPFINEINAQQLRPEILVRIYFDSGTTYNWTGVGPLVYNGNTYDGLGDLVSFGRMEESTVNKANGTVMVLSGIKSSLVSIALQEEYQGREVEIDFAVLNAAGTSVLGAYQLFAGKMDVMEIEDNGESATISVTVENENIDLFTPVGGNYTSEDQKARYPGDKGLDFIPFIQDIEIIWKEKEVKR